MGFVRFSVGIAGGGVVGYLLDDDVDAGWEGWAGFLSLLVINLILLNLLLLGRSLGLGTAGLGVLWGIIKLVVESLVVQLVLLEGVDVGDAESDTDTVRNCMLEMSFF